MSLRRRRLLSILALAPALAALSRLPLAQAAGERYLRIGTGPIGGSYFPIGGLIANVISSPPGSMTCSPRGGCGVPGVIAAAVASPGSVANLLDLANRTVDLAISQADVARDAYTAAGPFAGKPPLAQLRAIASLFGEALHLVTRRDNGIASVADLARRRVSLGERNSGTLATVRVVLQAYNLKESALIASYDSLVRAAGALANGSIDAFFMVGGYPLDAITPLTDTLSLALVPIAGERAASITASSSTLRPLTIPEGTYPGIGAIATLGPRAQLLTTSAMDDDLAFAITTALWDPRNRPVLDSGSALGREIRLARALEGLIIPLHAGAFRYYWQSGMKPSGER